LVRRDFERGYGNVEPEFKDVVEMRKLLCGGMLGLMLLATCLHPLGASARESVAESLLQRTPLDKDGDPPRPKPKPGHPEGGDDNLRPPAIMQDKSSDPPRPHPHPGHPEGGDDN